MSDYTFVCRRGNPGLDATCEVCRETFRGADYLRHATLGDLDIAICAGCERRCRTDHDYRVWASAQVRRRQEAKA